jgi:hypothetical protein
MMGHGRGPEVRVASAPGLHMREHNIVKHEAPGEKENIFRTCGPHPSISVNHDAGDICLVAKSERLSSTLSPDPGKS